MLMDLLVLLAENAGQVVTKERILDQVWQSRFVSESTLTSNVAELRRLLGEGPGRLRLIETISKRGYRLIAPVASGPPEPPRLAVLPFDNLSCDPEEDYFADGMADAVITELGRIAGLRVISRQSVLRFKGCGQSLAEIARELKVDTVVEGSALLAGRRVRITAQLIQVEPEQHLWAQSYECDLGDILAVQAQVARAIAEAVHAALTPLDLARLSCAPRVNSEAHVAYLKARHHGARWTQEGVEKGLQYLAEAIEKDPNYAPAYALLAVCLCVLGYWGHLPIQQAYPRAKAAALKAVELEDSLSEGHVALGLTQWMLDWDLPACEREIRRGLELNPSSEQAHFWLAMFLLIIRGDGRGALEEAKLALELDPLSLTTSFSVAYLLMFAGEYQQAADQARRTLELYPGALHAYYGLGWVYLGESRYAEAVAAFEKAAATSRDAFSLAYLGHAYGRAGQSRAAQAALAELRDLRERGYVPEFCFALPYAGLGDLDRAFESLERCYAERDGRLFWLAAAPCFDPLRSDPRYDDLLRRMALPAPQ
ncbi:MAG: tetratricopeptide repeat protein [Acidobacteria bacterium]|nr:tetratricopeptide repeat protein [Acidobacteriota bacterium]